MARSRVAADAFYADPTWEQIRFGLERLLSENAAPTERSWGEVTTAVLRGTQGRAELHGPLCPRIFGPEAIDRCRCGRFTIDTHGGDTCPHCGVLYSAANEREWRFGHIVLTAGILHPALHQAVADALGWRLSQLHELVAGEASLIDGIWSDRAGDLEELGMAALEKALAAVDQARLLLKIIPVLPAGDRPPLEILHNSGRRSQRSHPLSEAYIELVRRNKRVAQLRSLDAPLMLIASEYDAVQRAFETLMTPAVRGGVPVPLQVGIAPPENDEISGLWSNEEVRADTVVGALWLTEQEILVQRRNRTAILSMDGEVLSCWASDGLVAAWSSSDGAHIACVDRHQAGVEADFDSKKSLVYGAGVRVRKSGIWLKNWPGDLPCTLIASGEPEEAWMEDAHTGHHESLLPASDRPILTAWSHDGSCVWATNGGDEGQVRAADTGEVFAHIAKGEPLTALDLDGQHFDLEDDQDCDFGNTVEYGALGETDSGQWRVAWPDGVVGDGCGVFNLLAFTVGGFAWSPDASKLLVVTQDRLMVLRVDERGLHLLSHRPLPPFIL